MYLDNYHMHNDPNIYSENNEISCSDYRFVYMGAKGLRIFVIHSFGLSLSSHRYDLHKKFQGDLSPCLWFMQALGLLFMLMFSGHIAGQRMCVAKNGGFSSLPRKVILCLAGKFTISCTNSNHRDLYWESGTLDFVLL